MHFTEPNEEENLKPFYDMQLELLPQAMSWIGDDSDNENDAKDSTNLMYQLVKSMPSLFESDVVKKKRKRSKQRKVSDYFLPVVASH